MPQDLRGVAVAYNCAPKTGPNFTSCKEIDIE